MESRLKFKINNAQKAFQTFEDILKEPYSLMMRDAAIQRFEYTFESVWKMLKELLKEDKGVIANFPKTVFRSIFSAGWINEQETKMCLDMTDDRNETVHIYNEKIAEKIFAELKEYCKLMKKILETAKETLSD
ncbi:MAG: HI0074 family nucleotidyltransferase substrate-binding subunit [Elusimicrobiota bacterium]|nr:HI0074 family nucleotidyltransferase substrate-binding subunit [Elusimicrobiota bacterium]